MRKLSFTVLVVAMSIMSISAFAQEETTEVVEIVQEEAIEIQVNELPEAVTKAIANDLAGYKAEKAFKTLQNQEEVFWIVLLKDDTKIKVLFNSEGKVIEHNDSEQK